MIGLDARKVSRFIVYVAAIASFAIGFEIDSSAAMILGGLIWFDLFTADTIRLVAREFRNGRHAARRMK